MQDKQLIFGLGTGRCGTFSLTKLLNAQPGFNIGHESYVLPWEPDYGKLPMALDHFLALSGERVGDVSYSWLSYVPQILADHPDAKFICLYRERELVAKSFFNNTPGRNLWTDPKSEYWKEEWEDRDTDVYFPRYNADKLEAIGEYWETYWDRATILAAFNPDNFRMWHTEALNSLEGQTELFDFIGLSKFGRNYDIGVRVNVSNGAFITCTPVVSSGGGLCNVCGAVKADWRIMDERLGTFMYVCDPCKMQNKNLGRFHDSVTI